MSPSGGGFCFCSCLNCRLKRLACHSCRQFETDLRAANTCLLRVFLHQVQDITQTTTDSPASSATRPNASASTRFRPRPNTSACVQTHTPLCSPRPKSSNASKNVQTHPPACKRTVKLPFASKCINHQCASICINMYPYTSMYIHVHPHASICIHMHPYASICIHMHPYASMCIHMHTIHLHPCASTFAQIRPRCSGLFKPLAGQQGEAPQAVRVHLNAFECIWMQTDAYGCKRMHMDT